MARPVWGRRIEFFLTAVGFSIGVGDLWRFPYLVMKNGGGAFLIPVIIFNVFLAIPIVYLEMLIGQYTQSGILTVWNVCPLMKGVGIGIVVMTFLFSIYYAVIICWMVYYFVSSLSATLPWSTCDNEWNVPETCTISTADTLNKTLLTSGVHTTYNAVLNRSSLSGGYAVLENVTGTVAPVVSSIVSMAGNASDVALPKSTAAEQFWLYKVLRLSSGLHDLGDVNWHLVACLAAIEVACFFCIFKGVAITGKVVYFTVIGPFVLLAVFLVHGSMLEGSTIGILYYITPDVTKLLQPKIWAEACMQVFRSIGPGQGAMITFSSYNKFTNNCLRDAIFVCLADLCTGLLGGFVIFSILGHVSYTTGIDIKSFSKSGFGLGFIAYPEAAMYLPPPQLWCALFFFMSIFLGLDSQFPLYEIVVTAIRDEFPVFMKKKSALLTLVIITCAFLLAIPQVTQGGMYVLTLVDWYTATFSVTVFALIEVIVMVYIYGMSGIDDMSIAMTGSSVPIVFKVCWYVVTPVMLVVEILCAIITYRPPNYEGYVYPGWAVWMGWMMAICSLVPIPVYMVYKLSITPGNMKERLLVNCRPNEHWGPRKLTIDEHNKVEETKI